MRRRLTLGIHHNPDFGQRTNNTDPIHRLPENLPERAQRTSTHLVVQPQLSTPTSPGSNEARPEKPHDPPGISRMDQVQRAPHRPRANTFDNQPAITGSHLNGSHVLRLQRHHITKINSRSNKTLSPHPSRKRLVNSHRKVHDHRL
jgi:hypothetical protein